VYLYQLRFVYLLYLTFVYKLVAMSYVYVPHRTIFADIKESSDELLRLISKEPSKVVRKRLMALQLYVSGQGYNAAEIASKLGAAPVTVKKVFAVYRESGLQALLQAPHEGRPKGVPKAVYRETLEIVKQELSQPDAPFSILRGRSKAV